MYNRLPKLNVIPNENELFQVSVKSLSTFTESMLTSLYYMLTLILCEEDENLLLLTPPGFTYPYPSLSPRTDKINRIIQVTFSDFLVELFHKKSFHSVGKILKQSTCGIVFSQNTTLQVKDQIVRLATDNFESNIQFLHLMKEISNSEDKKTLLAKEIPGKKISSHIVNKINKVRNYVLENYRKQIKISDIAEVAGLSEYSFSHFFKVNTGLNFIDFVNEIRLEQASRLLRDTDDTIIGIAYSCGFNTPCYFNEIFRDNKGMTPGEFRNHFLN